MTIFNSSSLRRGRLFGAGLLVLMGSLVWAQPKSPTKNATPREMGLVRQIADLSIDPQRSLRDSYESYIQQVIDRREHQSKIIDELLAEFPNTEYRDIALSQKIEALYTLSVLRETPFTEAEALADRVLADDPNRILAGTAKYWKIRCEVEKMAAAGKGFEELMEMQKKQFGDFAREYPENPFAEQPLGMLAQIALMEDRIEEAEKYFKLLKEHHPRSEILMQLDVEFWKRNSLNKPFAMKFTDLKGKTVDLSKMKGKVVLVDFWATWCGGCLQFLPELKRIYRKYHEKGLEVVGVSLDYQKSTLESFVKANGITWPQYCDGSGWNSPMAREYRVIALPTMYLVDKKGNLRNVDLQGGLDAEISKLLTE